MKKEKLNFMGLVLAFLVVPFFTISCKDDGDKPGNVNADAPTITSISPESGEAGTIITLTGTDFGTDASKVRVRFNTINAAAIVSVTNTQIKVEAPAGFSDHLVNVRASVGERSSNAVSFYYKDTAPPSIVSATATCFAGSTVIISGNNFSVEKEDNIVKFGEIEAAVTAATKSSLTVTAPDLGAATSANITVTKYNMVSNARNITVDVDQNKVATHAWTTHTVRPGVVYKKGNFSVFGSGIRYIYILDVTLDETNTLGIGYSATSKYTTTLCNDNGAIAGINAGYFGGNDPKDPYIRINGEMKQAGHADANQIYTNSALIIHNNIATVRKFTENHRNLNQVAALIPVSQAQNVIVSGPILITNGVIEQQNMNSGHNTSVTARTGLGVSADGKRVFMVVVDSGGSSTGVQTPQLAKILQALGAVNAMNFDGGGSSTMFIQNQGLNGLVNLPYGVATQRAVRSVIYVK